MADILSIEPEVPIEPELLQQAVESTLDVESIMHGLLNPDGGSDLHGARLLLTSEIVVRLQTEQGMAELQNLLQRLAQEGIANKDNEDALSRIQFMEKRIARRVKAAQYVRALRENRVDEAENLFQELQAFRSPGKAMTTEQTKARYMAWAGEYTYAGGEVGSIQKDEQIDKGEEVNAVDVVEKEEEGAEKQMTKDELIIALHIALKTGDTKDILKYYRALGAEVKPRMKFMVVQALEAKQAITYIAEIFTHDETMRDVIMQALNAESILELYDHLGNDELREAFNERIKSNVEAYKIRAAISRRGGNSTENGDYAQPAA